MLLISYLFAFRNYKFQERLGYDERFPLTEDKTLIKKIIENHEKKELLVYLNSENVSIFDKINKISEFYGNMPKPMNISSGGLLDDWNFEI